MDINNISIPEIYQTSSDFRTFLKWISLCFSRLQYDIENMPDLYDALRCPSDLLWMLADTMGYKYDDRFSSAYIRLVLLYFMSLIRNRGSKDGVTLAAELNLAQFNIENKGKSDNIQYDRLEDTSIPVNAAYVTQHTAAGYIDVVYFADTIPTDACLEYVRPLGMYCFQSAGVRCRTNTRISVEAKLADYVNKNQGEHTVTATHVGHYRRSDYASMQKTAIIPENTTPGIYIHPSQLYEHAEAGESWETNKFYQKNADGSYSLLLSEPTDFDSSDYYCRIIYSQQLDVIQDRENVWYRNSKYEGVTNPKIDPGYRAISSLQLCNNDNVVKSLIHSEIFDMGYEPQDVDSFVSDSPLKEEFNLIYNADNEPDTIVTTVVGGTSTRPIPMINPIMATIGDAMTMDSTHHTKVDSNGDISIVEDTPVV